MSGNVIAFWQNLLSNIFTLTFFILTLWAACHALLYKRDSRAAVIWVGLILFSPGVGAFLYYIFGINRIRRRAAALKDLPTVPRPTLQEAPDLHRFHIAPQRLKLIKYGDSVLKEPITTGNTVQMLVNGDQAYPAMLDAIEQARTSISLETYIFGNDAQGDAFLEALQRATKRGVAVRLLIDGVGLHYSFPSVSWRLKKLGIPHAFFLPSLWPWRLSYANLRNHRKILVIDGQIGFTGGMNIRDYAKLAVNDLHFRLEGPIVNRLQRVFVEDWYFCTREQLTGAAWFPELGAVGDVVARGIPDGPDEDFEKIHWMLLGAIANAQRSIRIQTPYFIPDSKLISALNIATLSGINVQILIPEKGNLKLVQWASTAQLWQLLERGCQIYLVPPPFDHSKLMIVDEDWTLIGSSNWDARSLRLNFEFNVECYDAGVAREAIAIFQQKLSQSRPLTFEEVENYPLPVKLRNGVFRLFSPHL